MGKVVVEELAYLAVAHLDALGEQVAVLEQQQTLTQVLAELAHVDASAGQPAPQRCAATGVEYRLG